MRPTGRAEELERRRYRAVELMGGGVPRKLIARVFGVSPSSLARWCKLAEAGALGAKPVPGRPPRLTDEDYRELEHGLVEVYDRAIAHCRPGAGLAELDVLVRDGIAALGYPGQPSHPICHGIGARAHEPPYAHQAGGGTVTEGMVLAIEPGCYWEGGGGLRVEDNFLITADGPEKLSPFPDGVVACRS